MLIDHDHTETPATIRLKRPATIAEIRTFMNERVVKWWRGQGLEVTRARAYRKNDQAWVEKNGAIVRPWSAMVDSKVWSRCRC